MNMKSYVFCYFANLDGFFKEHEFLVTSPRFSQAFKCFCDFFNSLVTCDGVKDYCVTYNIVVDGRRSFRMLRSKYLSFLHRSVPEV